MSVVAQPFRKPQATPATAQRAGASQGRRLRAVPKTQLGQLALRLSEQSTAAVLSIVATSAYVYALTETTSPSITFTDWPPNMKGQSALTELQSAYKNFQSQFALIQGQAMPWINTQLSSNTASILSQLVAVPDLLNDINSGVTSDFTALANLDPGTDAYNAVLAKLEGLIGSSTDNVINLVSQMQTLGQTLNKATTSLIASTQPNEILGQLLAAYASDVAALQKDEGSANAQITSDTHKIAGEGIGTAASMAVGLVGLTMFWFPLGWVLIAVGAIGAAAALSEIESLNAQIGTLRTNVQADIQYKTADEAAATLLSAFCTQLQGFSSINASAEQELITLQNLYSTLASDIATAVADLEAGDLADAQEEWSTVLSEAQFLQGLTAYLWPTPTQLSAPSSMAAVGGDLFCIAASGELYHYSATSNAWSDMGVTALSIVGAGNLLVAIDGAPLNGTEGSGNPPASTFYAKLYDIEEGTWTTISTTACSAVAIGGTEIYAINQSDCKVYQYCGFGTEWNPLPQLPGPDMAIQIAVAGGTVFALANNSQAVYAFSTSGSWSVFGTDLAPTYRTIKGNGDQLALLDTAANLFNYDVSTAGTQVQTGAGEALVAQLSSSAQVVVDMAQGLWSGGPAAPMVWTSLATNATGVTASDTDVVFYIDNLGNLYAMTSGTITPLPAMLAS